MSLTLLIKRIWRVILWNFIAPSQFYGGKFLIFLLRKNPIHISSSCFGPPREIYPLTSDWVSSQKRSNTFRYKEIEPKHSIEKKNPKLLDKEIHWEFTKWKTLESSVLFVVELNNGRVVGSGRAIITPDDYILGDVSPEYRSNPKEHSLLSRLKLPALTKTSETIAVLANSGGANYYHWLFDVLPRFHVLEKSEFNLQQVDRFLLNKISQPFQVETLTALGIERNRIVEADENLHLQAKRLIVPSLAGIIGHPSKWSCQFLRNRFLKSNQEIKPSIYLYISRSKAARRRVLNETTISEILKQAGFKIVNFEDFSFREQVNLISSASVVVAPHGAALANLVFCCPHTKIIEFFAPKYINQCYWALANQSELDYYYLIGEGEKLAKGTFDPTYVQDDMVVNIEKMLKLLQLAEIKV